jgi:dTDP-glucose 4,6-dehydratase
MVDDPRRRCPDITLAERVLGWRPEVDVVDGLRRTAAESFDRPIAG